MVKPLNKEWELFGRKYRVAGAKGEKVDCNACQKQVSAAVNRLQSHLRVCPARPVGLADHIHGSVGIAVTGSVGGPHVASDLDVSIAAHRPALMDATETDAGLRVDSTSDLGRATLDSVGLLSGTGLGSVASVSTPAATHTTSTTTITPNSTSSGGMMDTNGQPATKRARMSPTRGTTSSSSSSLPASATTTSSATRDRLRWPTTSDDYWLASAAAAASSPVPPTAAYAKRRLEIEEKRLQLELVREHREQKRERFQLEILEAQARKERLAAEKEAYEARVLLALSRKQLRDQGVAEDEIDRVLPTEPLGATLSPSEAGSVDSTETENAGHAEAAAANAAALQASAKITSHDAALL